MHNFNAGVAGKSGPVEGENGSEAMHQHGGYQPGVVRLLAVDRSDPAALQVVEAPVKDFPRGGQFIKVTGHGIFNQ